jgi:recombination protein RecR
MDPIERLVNLFEKFPGIGPRQANRFVQFLLRSAPSTRRELIAAVQELGGSVHQCPDCMRWHAGASAKAAAQHLCAICANPSRDRSLLAIVASDSDLMALERSGEFRGTYFVLGGTIHLASEKANGLRTKELLASLSERMKQGLAEVVLAFPANPEGDVTATYIRSELAAVPYMGLKVTTLGRGLSTGSELEYADPETIKSALDSRR